MKSYEIISIFTYGFSKLIPKKRNRWVFGAWFGKAVSDNTKALYDYIEKNHPEIERVWISSEPGNVQLPGCIVAKKNSLKSLRYILTAKVAVMNQGFGDFSAYNFLGGAYKVQLWHGVAWKKIVRDAVPELKGFYEKVFQLINHYDLYIAPSKKYGRILKSAFKTNNSHIMYTGQPRNAVLFSEEYKEKCRSEIEELTGANGKKLVVYMPTFRDKTSDVFSFHSLETRDEFRLLAEKNNFVVIEKLHYKNDQHEEADSVERVVHGLPNMDAAKLLAAADLLITDYSSCFFDYLITDRPVIHFVYDYEYYKNKDRGLYFDIDEVAAGMICENENELLGAIDESLLHDPEKDRRHRVRKRFITYETEDSPKAICNRIMENI